MVGAIMLLSAPVKTRLLDLEVEEFIHCLLRCMPLCVNISSLGVAVGSSAAISIRSIVVRPAQDFGWILNALCEARVAFKSVLMTDGM
jgi:hypothetical protein